MLLGLVAGVVWEHVRRGKPGRAENGGRLPKSHEHVGTRALEIPRIFELLPLSRSVLYLISFKAGMDTGHLYCCGFIKSCSINKPCPSSGVKPEEVSVAQTLDADHTEVWVGGRLAGCSHLL